MESASSRDLNVQFNGANIVTTVTDDSFKVEYVLTELRASLPTSPVDRIIGLDIKHTSNANEGRHERVATLQLSHRNRCLVIQLLHLDSIPKSLRNFLADTSMNFFGVNIKQEIFKLERDYGLKCHICFELGSKTDEICESYYKYSNLGLSEIAAEILGVVIAKPPSVALSDWGVRVLSSEQVKFATIDAYAPFAIIHRLSTTKDNYSEAMGYYQLLEDALHEMRLRDTERSMGLP